EMSLTDTADVLGSPHYMSPEQVRSSKLVDPRTDIWAIGVVLHKLLTTDTPFAGENFSAVCAAIVADEPVRVRAVRPDVPEGVAYAVLKCLAKAPADRFQSTEDLARTLSPFAPSYVQLRQAARPRVDMPPPPALSSAQVLGPTLA